MYTTTTIRCAHADSVAGEEAQIKTHLLGTQSFQLTVCMLCVPSMCVCMHVFMHAGVCVYVENVVRRSYTQRHSAICCN